MHMTFASLVDEIQKLSTEQKEEMKSLLERYLIEERRQEMFDNLQQSKKNFKES